MKDLYVHYETVTNHVLTRGVDLIYDDFSNEFFPENMILSEEPVDFGRFDAQTNFKIERTVLSMRFLLTFHSLILFSKCPSSSYFPDNPQQTASTPRVSQIWKRCALVAPTTPCLVVNNTVGLSIHSLATAAG